MSKCRVVLILLTTAMLSMQAQARFPEFNFCPLGGPPGWINRITGEHDKRTYYPPPPMYPLLVPGQWQVPQQPYPEHLPPRPWLKR